MKKFFTKVVCYILIFSMLITNFPIYALAEIYYELPETAQTPEINFEDRPALEEEETPEIVGEVIEKRTANEKHFRMSDGSFMVSVYAEDVHYEENGIFKEIDNTLVKEGNFYVNKTNSLKAKFNSETNDNLLQLEYEGYQLSLNLKDSKKIKAKIQEDKVEKSILKSEFSDTLNSINEKKLEVKEKNTEKTQLDNFKKIELEPNVSSSKLSYENILSDVDANYKVTSNKVKEDIVLKNASALQNQFVYDIHIANLQVVQEEDNLIALVNPQTEEIIFYIEAPYMYDANGEYSSNIQLRIENNELIVQPDKEWLYDENRVFPIVIDPIISTDTRRNKIQDCYIYEGDMNNSSKCAAHVVRVGNSKWNEVNKKPVRSVVKFDLPTLSSGDQVVGAQLSLFSYNYGIENWTYPTSNIQVDVHKLLTDWTETTANWNLLGAQNNWESKVTDYFTFSYSASDPIKMYSADITSIVKDWYVSGNNYGVMLKSKEDVTSNADAFFFSSDVTSNYETARPIILIQYRNQTGLESYMTYHQQNLGRVTTYTNDYNGNLTMVHADLSTPGTRFPVSINHVYNTNDNGIDIGYGNGFRLNLSQTLKEINIPNSQYQQYIEYIDEDGTRHYFYLENGTWKDEDGLGLTLTLSGTTFTMKDKGGNTSTFTKINDMYYLKTIKDTSGNMITINYTGSLITSVVDGAGDTLTLTYNSDNKLNQIIDPAGRIINYEYTSKSYLTKIKYPDNKFITIGYDYGRIIHIYSIDNALVTYQYYNVQPYRVKKIVEYGTDLLQGNYIDISYGHNSTTFKDREGKINTYTFNNLGNTISVSNQADSNRNGIYGKTYQYDTSTNTVNHLTLESDLVKSVENQLVNHSFENSGTWYYQQWGSTPGSCGPSEEVSRLGKWSLKCLNTKATDGPKVLQGLTPKKGKTYTLSGYVKLADIDESAYGVTLTAHYLDKDRVARYVSSEAIKVDTDWTRLSVTFEYPADSTSNLYVILGLSGIGTAYFDNIQLEEGEVANDYNIVENGGFQNGMNSWITWNFTSNDTIQEIDGNNAFKMIGVSNSMKSLAQVINISGKKGDSYQWNIWYKNDGLPHKGNRSSDIRLTIVGQDGKRYWPGGAKFNTDSNEWQTLSLEFVMPVDYSSFNIEIAHNYNENYLYFDNITLFKDISGNSYTYDSNGNVISSKDNAKLESTFQYDGKNQLISETSFSGIHYNYEYSSEYQNRLLKATDNQLSYHFGYDTYGNNTSLKIMNKEGNSKYVETEQSFNNNGNYVTSKIDQLGNTTSMTYNTSTGTLTSITDRNNNTIDYTYDTLNRVTKVESGDISNQYSYVNDNLSTITHNGFNYSFTYDRFHNLKNVKVGNQSLITNNYAVYSSNLLSSTYGNGQTVTYTYDGFNRVESKTNSTGTTNYYYNNRGNLSKATRGNNVYLYEYDLASRLVNYKENDYKIHYGYDSISNISNVDYLFNGHNKRIDYTYNDNNQLTKINNVEYTYDELARLITKKLGTFTANYEYKDVNDNKTSTVVSSITNNGNKLGYTYDNNGNIIEIYNNNVKTNEYVYDGLNQLIQEKDYKHNQKVTYSYDNGGNILKKSYYQLDTDTLIDEITYTYTNSWKDQLTSYNGTGITYDEIGNPLTYGNTSFTWQNGRELARYQDTNLDITYQYNDSGIRTSKTINGITTKYYLDGSNIIFEDRNGETIYYFYDASGVAGFEYDGNTYYYVKNLQNDVIGILDSEYNQIVSYEYDSWGKVLSIKDGSGNEITDSNHIGNINPFRYRSYYYDSEISLYYLNSRYYNPAWGRFINADGIMATLELDNLYNKNIYAYTDNNPVNRIDTQGEGWWGIAGAFFGAISSGLGRVAYNVISGRSLGDGLYGAMAGGAITGFLLTTTFNTALAYYAGSAVESIVNESVPYISGEKPLTTDNIVNSVNTVVVDTAVNGTIGVITGNMAGKKVKTNPGWFTPKKLVSSFTGNYAKKVLGQNIYQNTYQLIIGLTLEPTTVYAPGAAVDDKLWCPVEWGN